MHACDALCVVSVPLSNIVVSESRIIPMTKWVCRWKPFWVPRGDTFQKAYLEGWEQEDDDQSYFRGEESKNSHRSRSVPRTTTSESLRTVQDDGWSATRELPAPRGCQQCQNGASHMCDTMSFLRELGRVCPDPQARTRKVAVEPNRASLREYWQM